MKNIKLNIFKFGLLALGFAFFSCEKDDYTNDSIMTPNATNVSITTPFSQTTLVEDNSVYNVEINLSSIQVVDVKIYLSVISGTATEGDDFTMDHEIIIPAGSTKGFAKITVLQDDFFEDIENFKVQVGNSLTANADISSVKTIDFTILNYTEGDLVIDLSWFMSEATTDNSGNPISPTTFADMRLLLCSEPNNDAVIDGADGGSYETFVLTSDMSDGDYYVIADFYDVNSSIDRDLDLTLGFFQSGVINDLSYNYAQALNSTNSCSAVYYVMAKVTKTGTNYEIASIGENSPVSASSFIGTATVEVDDWADYHAGDEITIEAGSNPNEFWIRSYANPYINNPDTCYMIVTIDPATGNVTVSSNEAFDYGQGNIGGISGTGTVNACAKSIDLNLTFDLGPWGVYADNNFVLTVN